MTKGPIKIEVKAFDSYFFCTCGKSPKPPFCKKAHKGTDFKPKRVIFDEDQTILACFCMKSKHHPYCDGSHKDRE